MSSKCAQATSTIISAIPSQTMETGSHSTPNSDWGSNSVIKTQINSCDAPRSSSDSNSTTMSDIIGSISSRNKTVQPASTHHDHLQETHPHRVNYNRMQMHPTWYAQPGKIPIAGRENFYYFLLSSVHQQSHHEREFWNNTPIVQPARVKNGAKTIIGFLRRSNDTEASRARRPDGEPIWVVYRLDATDKIELGESFGT